MAYISHRCQLYPVLLLGHEPTPNLKITPWTLNISATLPLSEKMCIRVQPVCNACSTNAKPVEIHECEFRECNPEYMEDCTRFLCRHELVGWDCDTPGCGLNMRTIDDSLAAIDRMLHMQFDLPFRLAEGDSLRSHEDNHDGHTGSNFFGFDGDGTLLARATRSATRVNVNPDDGVSPGNSGVANNDVAANDNSANNDNAAADEYIEVVYEADPFNLDTFPRCRYCFLGRRRCDGQTPCDKCRQRRSPGACRPVTAELLRQYPARAERVLELARRNGASS